MPLYEYECNSCKKRFEQRQKVTEDAVSICPSCGGAVRRIIHPVGIIFKGSGFYVTDNRKGDTPSSTNGTADAAASKSGEGAKAESGAKPDSGKSDSGSKADSSGSSSGSSTSSESANKPAATTTATSSKD